MRTHSTRFAWADDRTAANPGGCEHFERLIGRRDIRPVLEHAANTVTAERIGQWVASDDWASRVGSVVSYR